MGMIRGALLTLVAILLFLSLFSMNTLWTISNSLEYEALKPEMTTIVNDMVRSETDTAANIDSSLGNLQLICQNATEVVQQWDEKVFTVPCEVVNQGSEAVITYVITDFVEKIYYDEYDCDFWACSYSPPYHLVSAKAQSYWQGWFYTAMIISVLLVVGGFFLIENKKSYPFVLGGLIFFSAIPFVKVSWLLSLLGSWEFLSFFTIFFSKSYSVFLTMFVLALVLVGVGVVLKFLAIGNFLSKLFGGSPGKVDKKELKEEIKEEIKAEAKGKKKAK